MGIRFNYTWSTIDDEWKTYINFLESNKIFSVCENKTVLEFASNDSWHARLILNTAPKSLVCVEPDVYFKDSLEELTTDFDNVTYFPGTANDFYNTDSSAVDVVVCMGLLYHLASPLELIEKIINKSKPKHLIIETTSNSTDISILPELVNDNGNAQLDKDKEIMVPWCTVINDKTYIKILESVGYKCITHIDYRYLDFIDHPSKEYCVMMIFEKVNCEEE